MEIFGPCKYFHRGNILHRKEWCVIDSRDLSQQEQAILQAISRMQSIPLGQLYPVLGPGEGRMLSILICSDGGLTVSALSEKMNAPMPTVSRMMRSMEERGLIERRILPQDRRSILVTATPHGEQVHKELMFFFHSFFSDLLVSFDSEEFDRMICDWNLLMDRMEELIPIYNQRIRSAAAEGLPCSALEPGPGVDPGGPLL